MGGLGQEMWGGVMSGSFVLMVGTGICIGCGADTFASYVQPVFNPVAPYRYLLHNVYLSVIDISN